MGLSLQMQISVNQALQICGGVTESVFPEAEAWLLSDSDHQSALEFIASKKNMNRYHSLVDFLFVELVPRYRRSCFAFYNNDGPLLKDMITLEEHDSYRRLLLAALEVALQAFHARQPMLWDNFRAAAYQAVA